MINTIIKLLIHLKVWRWQLEKVRLVVRVAARKVQLEMAGHPRSVATAVVQSWGTVPGITERRKFARSGIVQFRNSKR